MELWFARGVPPGALMLINAPGVLLDPNHLLYSEATGLCLAARGSACVPCGRTRRTRRHRGAPPRNRRSVSPWRCEGRDLLDCLIQRERGPAYTPNGLPRIQLFGSSVWH